MSTRSLVSLASLAAAMLLLACAAPAKAQSRYEAARREMVQEAVIGSGVRDRKVIKAMLSTPRHEFVAPRLRGQAHMDMALPIGEQQTISSPFIVAYMTESLNPQPTDKVLEIGTGSGYQAAVLSHLVKEVYSIEIIESLGEKAARTLDRLEYDNVFTKIGDGFQGWEEHAPFDKIIVTCSPEKPPKPLVEQLKEGGLMVIPAGQRYQQTLYLMRKKDGKVEKEALRPTLFVPMTGVAEENRQVQPDPTNPRAVNGDFEQPVEENGFVPGWYYQRQLSWETGEDAPQGKHFIRLHNEEPGRSAHLLQGVPIDGEQVAAVRLSARVRCRDVRYPRDSQVFPSVGVTFYDKDRQDLGHHWLGPFRGNSRWRRFTKTFRVPPQTHEAILRVGLFGATGDLFVDNVQIGAVSR